MYFCQTTRPITKFRTLTMDYKKIYPDNLFFCDINSLNKADLIEFFADNPYKYVYLQKDGKLVGVLDKKSFMADPDTYAQSLEKDFVFQFDSEPTSLAVKKLLTRLGSIKRICIIVGGEIKYEIVDQKLFDIPRETVKDLLAARYIECFSVYIKEYFERNEIKKILWLGEELYLNKLRSIIPDVEVVHRRCFIANESFSDFDIVFDVKYFDILYLLSQGNNVTRFNQLIENIALQTIMKETSARGVQLFFLHLPNFNEIFSFLTEKEKEQAANSKNFVDLLADEEYLNSFAESHDDKSYLLKEDYQATSVFDDGEKMIQGNIDSIGIHVKNGIRRTIPAAVAATSRNIHILGTCTAFGMCTPDDKTIASHLQKMLNKANIAANVFNHGAMQGSFLLNSLISALLLKVSDGDIIAILDDFENCVKQNISSLIKTAEWFAFEDKKNLHCFWDNATHCSSAGNKIFAQRIFNLCSFKILNAEQNKNKMLTKNALKALEEKQFHLTPSAFIHMKELKKYCNISCSKRGLVLIHACPFTKGHKYLVDTALKTVDHLFVFVVAEYFHGYSVFDRYDMVRKALESYNNVTVLQSEKYFVNKQLFPEYGQRTSPLNNTDDVERNEKLLASILCDKLGITHRFIGEEPNDQVTAKYNCIVKKYCEQYNIKCCVVPRMTIDGIIVSAKTFRKMLSAGDIANARKFVPITTLTHIFRNTIPPAPIYLILHRHIRKSDKEFITERLEQYFSDIRCIDF